MTLYDLFIIIVHYISCRRALPRGQRHDVALCARFCSLARRRHASSREGGERGSREGGERGIAAEEVWRGASQPRVWGESGILPHGTRTHPPLPPRYPNPPLQADLLYVLWALMGGKTKQEAQRRRVALEGVFLSPPTSAREDAYSAAVRCLPLHSLSSVDLVATPAGALSKYSAQPWSSRPGVVSTQARRAGAACDCGRLWEIVGDCGR